jgi:hypothetical protein
MTHRNSCNEEEDAAPVDYELTCWYLNKRRVIELVGANAVASWIRPVTALCDIDDGLKATVIIAALENRLTEWFRAASPPTVGQLLVKEKLHPGILFTHYDRYFCNGISIAVDAAGDAAHL